MSLLLLVVVAWCWNEVNFTGGGKWEIYLNTRHRFTETINFFAKCVRYEVIPMETDSQAWKAGQKSLRLSALFYSQATFFVTKNMIIKTKKNYSRFFGSSFVHAKQAQKPLQGGTWDVCRVSLLLGIGFYFLISIVSVGIMRLSTDLLLNSNHVSIINQSNQPQKPNIERYFNWMFNCKADWVCALSSIRPASPRALLRSPGGQPTPGAPSPSSSSASWARPRAPRGSRRHENTLGPCGQNLIEIRSNKCKKKIRLQLSNRYQFNTHKLSNKQVKK